MANKDNFSLNFNNLKELPFQNYDKDFDFIVNGKKYPTTRLEADILSPIIRNMHFSDETINNFTIKYDNEFDGNDYFDDFLQLCSLNECQIDSKRRKLYSKYFLKLGNVDEYFSILYGGNETFTTSNAFEILEEIFKLTKSFSKEQCFRFPKMNELITFISSHFPEFENIKFHDVPVEILEEILRQKSLKLKDEDSLLSLVLDLYKKDRQYSALFEYVIFANVSQEMLESFVKEFELEDMNCKIWETISDRLLSKPVLSNNSRYEMFLEFNYESGNEFKGIFNHIKSNGKLESEVKVTCSSCRGSYSPLNTLNYDSDNYFYTNEKNAWIRFEFIKHRIILSSYSMSSYGGTCDAHPKNWIVEGSNDGTNWEPINKQENSSSLKETNSYSNFSVSNSKQFKFVQIRQTGLTWRNDDVFLLKYVEFFGKLI